MLLRAAQIPTGAADKFAIILSCFRVESSPSERTKIYGKNLVMGSNGKITSATVSILKDYSLT